MTKKEELKEMIKEMFEDGGIELEVNQDRFKTAIGISILIDGEVIAVAK